MLKKIDQQLLALHQKLRASDNIVVQHRLVQQIDKLLDERLKLTKPSKP